MTPPRKISVHHPDPTPPDRITLPSSPPAPAAPPPAVTAAVEGPEGPIGPQGIPGPEGPEGPVGPPGANGRDGADGPPGEVGHEGPPGPPGAEGPPGPPGQDGGVVPLLIDDEGQRQGAVLEMDFIGDGVTAVVEGSIARITIPGGQRGPMGPAGRDGGTGTGGGGVGPQGPPGPQGPQGPAGLNGVDGADGATGPMGPPIDVEDEGVLQGPATIMDFVGAGVSVAVAGGQATVTIPGGGGAIAYGSPVESQIADVGADGILATVARADHVHDRHDDAIWLFARVNA